MTIEKLPVLPSPVKSATGYEFDSKYYDRVFIHGNYYIVFNEGKYDSIPKTLLDNVIDVLLEERLNQITKDIYEEVSEKINGNIEPIIEQRFEIINSHFDNINESLNEKVEINDIEDVIKSHIPKIEKSLSTDEIKEIVEDRLSTSLKHVDNLLNSKINELLSLVKTQAQTITELENEIKNLKTSDPKELIYQELKLVYDNLPSIVDELISKRIKDSKNINEKLTPGKLFAMKEGGLSIQEITDLHKSGVI
jgi:uncharacterized Zn finger protein